MEEGNNKMVGTAVWDARRLVREYVKIAWMANDSIPFDELPWDNQIRVKRVAAVICAYLDIMSDDGDAFELIGRVFSSFDNSEVLKRSFTERELIEKYNYPSTTDEELLDWRIDNF